MASATACARAFRRGLRRALEIARYRVDLRRLRQRQQVRIALDQARDRDRLGHHVADAVAIQPVGGGARGPPVDHRPHRKLRAALADILMDRIVGEARERLCLFGDDGLDLRHAQRARRVHHLLEQIIRHTRCLP